MSPNPSNAGYFRLPSYLQDTTYFKSHARRQFKLKCVGLAFAWNLFYGLTLEGRHTPEEMNVLIGKLGVFMLLAELCLTSLLFQICLYLRAWPRRIALLVIPLNLYAWYLYDHGNILEEHGAFNMLIFAMLGVPLNTVILTLYLWHRAAGSWRMFTYQFIGTWILFSFVSFVSLKNSYALLDVGFWGRTGQSACQDDPSGHCYSNQCVWDKPLPWVDLLPVPQNFFLGPMTCPKLDSFSATIDPNSNILTIQGCPAHEVTHVDSYFNGTRLASFSGPAVSYLPDTESWGYAAKEDSLSAPFNNFQQHVLSYVEENTHPYVPSGLDIGTTQSVLVRCGSLEPKVVFRVRPTPPTKETNTEGELNVMFVFLDAVSRRHFFRRMPKTVRTLEKFTVPSSQENIKDTQPVLHQFFRYHSIGLNTGPNTRALWADLPASDSKTGQPPIWEDFHDDGYVTGRLDGVCEDWNAFYNKDHFPSKSDSRIAPHVTHEFLSHSCLPPYLPVGKGFAGNFAGSTNMGAHCLSGQHIGWLQLDWLETFMKQYYEQQRKFFVTGVFLEGHEGSTEVIATLDDRLAKFLDPATSVINYNNTAVFVQADHGLHMGLNYIFFDNGHVEEVQPFSGLILPAWYTKKYGNKLKHNEDRLVTAHDFWATMQGMRGPTKARRSTHGGKNLVMEEVGNRSCEDLNIDPEACRCKIPGHAI
ncbi:hypothetical protein DFJ77DRAFT_263214 [Powellomyces hirtus]|nr:hypothetical protein DFJ77DRAFT_263214 [Powellomyces hirtus]